MTGDLVSRLLAAIQEREDVANEAGELALGGEWFSVVNAGSGAGGVESLKLVVAAGSPVEFNRHIAVNDPRSVLRLCQAHRDIVDDYQHAREVGDRLIERDCEVGTRVVQQRAVNALERAIRALARGYGIEDRDELMAERPRPRVTGWEKLARACRRYLDACEDEPADDVLGAVGNDLRIISTREVSRARDLHLAEVERDAETGRFRGRCSCGVSLGAEWHQVSSVTVEWANHLAALAGEENQRG